MGLFRSLVPHYLNEKSAKGKTAEEALAQIKSRHYADAFKMRGKEIVKVGLNFGIKDGANRLDWEVDK